MKVWLVKALLEIIENDKGIDDKESLFIQVDGMSKTKAEIISEGNYDLSAFLIGVLHYILSRRREKNSLRILTLDAIGEKKNRKPRRCTGNLEDAITRKVDVDFPPKRSVSGEGESADGTDAVENTLHKSDAIRDQSDDEVIRGSMNRSAMAVAEVLSAIPKLQVNVETLAGTFQQFGVAVACTPSREQITGNMTKALSTVATAVEANKNALAERIRENSRKEESVSQSEISGAKETATGETAEDKNNHYPITD